MNLNSLYSFFGLYALWIIGLLAVVIAFPHGHEILFIQGIRDPALDLLMSTLNRLGETIGVVVVVVYMLFRFRRYVVHFLLGIIVQSILSSGLKRLYDLPRPLKYFESLALVVPAGAPKLYEHSFPSGHTTMSFFLVSFVVFFFRPSPTVTLFILALAIGVGLARMYLVAHFAVDVLAGSLIGVLVSGAIHYVYLTQRTHIT